MVIRNFTKEDMESESLKKAAVLESPGFQSKAFAVKGLASKACCPFKAKAFPINSLVSEASFPFPGCWKHHNMGAGL